jgi:hypothetical protein
LIEEIPSRSLDFANSSTVKMETWSGDLRVGWNFKKGPSRIPPAAHGYLLALFSFTADKKIPNGLISWIKRSKKPSLPV